MNVKPGDLAFIVSGLNSGHVVTVIAAAGIPAIEGILGACWLVRASSATLRTHDFRLYSDGSTGCNNSIATECIAPDAILRPIHGSLNADGTESPVELNEPVAA